MKPVRRTSLNRARLLLITLCGCLCALIMLAPLLAAHAHYAAAALIYQFFSTLCHQQPVRSFTGWNYPWAVCHRCTGIYFGLFLGMLFSPNRMFNGWQPGHRRLFVLAACLPIFTDFMLPYAGLWTNTATSRALSGAFFGFMVGLLFMTALSEFVAEVPCTRSCLRFFQTKGVTS